MLRAVMLSVILLASPGSVRAVEARNASIDIVVLFDKSLSMVEEIDEAKNYLAGDIIGAVALPGDRLIVELFYGQVERLYGARIRSEEDKAAAVALLRDITADGRFTDIGQALDRAGAILEELGSPERPKWVVLITDERQEAPWGSRYYAADYVLKHPALEFVRKVDRGAFRVITVGLGLGPRVEETATTLMRLLREPPPRSAADFPELPADSDGSLASVACEGPEGSTGSGSRPGIDPAPGTWWILPLAAGLAGLALAATITATLLSRKRKREKSERSDGH